MERTSQENRLSEIPTSSVPTKGPNSSANFNRLDPEVLELESCVFPIEKTREEAYGRVSKKRDRLQFLTDGDCAWFGR